MANPAAWHNDAQLKTDVIAALIKDREADAFQQGFYMEQDDRNAVGHRGCSVGCLVATRTRQEKPSWHAEAQALFAFPQSISHLGDFLFERLPTENHEHAKFAVEWPNAIPVGADLSLVTSRFVLDLLEDPEHGIVLQVDDKSDTHKVLQTVIDLYKRRLSGKEPSTEEWRTAWAEASWEEEASWAAAWAEASWEEEASWAAASWEAASWEEASWATTDQYSWQAQRFIHHLSNAPVLEMTK